MDPVEYVRVAIEQIEQLAYHADRVDWPAARATSQANIEADPTPESAYREINAALDALADGHSFLLLPDDAAKMTGSGEGPIEVRMDASHVGIIRLDGFFGTHQDGVDAYAKTLSEQIDALASNGVRGWIIDLRQNRGGNMWPMLGGLASIIGIRDLGAFAFKGGKRESWRIADWVAMPPSISSHLVHPVAVLIGGVTASSGEAVAIAFIGRPGTRLFGEPTRGLSSANDEIRLADGALMFLTTSLFADGSGKVYGVPICPDESVSGEQATLDAARNWIASRLHASGG